jgi:hypothetical protein
LESASDLATVSASESDLASGLASAPELVLAWAMASVWEKVLDLAMELVLVLVPVLG